MEDVLPDSRRMGLEKLAGGGGFNLSVDPVDEVVLEGPSGFFTFNMPAWEELPS